MSAAKGNQYILVVDDEDLVVNVARASLESAGFSVLTAMTGEQAVALFREKAEEISAVFLDFSMPGMSGDQVFSQIRALRDDIPVVVSSGFEVYDTASRFHGDQPAGFLKKPFRPQDLIEKMRQVIS